MAKMSIKTAPEGNRCSVLKSGVARIGSISHKQDGTTIVANVNPILSTVKLLWSCSCSEKYYGNSDADGKTAPDIGQGGIPGTGIAADKKTNKSFANYIGRSGRVVDVLAMAQPRLYGANTVRSKKAEPGRELKVKAFIMPVPAVRVRLSGSTAGRFRRPCSSRSCSVMKKALLPALSGESLASLNWQIRGQFFSMRSARWTNTCAG